MIVSAHDNMTFSKQLLGRLSFYYLTKTLLHLTLKLFCNYYKHKLLTDMDLTEAGK